MQPVEGQRFEVAFRPPITASGIVLAPDPRAELLAFHGVISGDDKSQFAVGEVAERRLAVARDLHEAVFAWMLLGDERNLAATWVAGVEQYRRGATTETTR